MSALCMTFLSEPFNVCLLNMALNRYSIGLIPDAVDDDDDDYRALISIEI